MGPYYLTAIVALLGPVARVAGFASTRAASATIEIGPRAGERFTRLDADAHGRRAASSRAASRRPSSRASRRRASTSATSGIYGSDGRDRAPRSELLRRRRSGCAGAGGDWEDVPYASRGARESRGLGLAEMVEAIEAGRPHRASGELGRHVVGVARGDPRMPPPAGARSRSTIACRPAGADAVTRSMPTGRIVTHRAPSHDGAVRARLHEDGIAFRDRNRNGRLDPFEDPRRPVEERVADLLDQMTLEEKAGMMFHQARRGRRRTASSSRSSAPFSAATTSDLVCSPPAHHFNVYSTPEPRLLAEWHNRLQRLAESTRLAIPVTLSTDPRHGFSANPATSWAGGHFSQWPEPLGLAATRDAGLVDGVRRYRPPGVPRRRHPRRTASRRPTSRPSRAGRALAGTFGEDAELAARMVAAYIRGFQGAELRARQRRLYDQALPRRRARRTTARTRTSPTGESRSTPATTSTTT